MVKRKPSLRLLADQIKYAGLRRQEYESVHQGICAKNYHSLYWMSLLVLAVMAGLAVLTFFVPAIKAFRAAYISFFMLLAVVFILTRTLASKNKKLVMPLIYLMLLAAYAFSIAIGTFMQPETTAAVFPALLFALPLLLTDRPYRCALLLAAATAAFCVCASVFKPGEIFQTDMINAICFCIISLACNQYTMRSKLGELVNRRGIEHEQNTDGLTKLLNRTAGQREILEYIERGRETAILILLDIDMFKTINDSQGNAVGDNALRLFSECIKETFRQSDILVRFGGDVFLAFMPYVQDRDCVKKQIFALEESIKAHVHEYEKVPPLSFSAGVSIYPHDANAYDELVKMAEDALRFSKNNRNTVSFYRDCFGNGKQSGIPAGGKVAIHKRKA